MNYHSFLEGASRGEFGPGSGAGDAQPGFAVAALNASVHLRDDTTFRLDFERPRLVLGPRSRPLLSFEIGPSSEIARANPKKGGLPPVNLCTTYLDDRLRLGLATKGTKLVFSNDFVSKTLFFGNLEGHFGFPGRPKVFIEAVI